jgi:hypothetical protein
MCFEMLGKRFWWGIVDVVVRALAVTAISTLVRGRVYERFAFRKRMTRPHELLHEE